MSSSKCLAIFFTFDHPSRAKADRGGGPQAALLDARGHLRERTLGRREQLVALARPLGGEGRVAADDEPFARELRARDLGEVALVEQPELEVTRVNECPDGGGAQAAHPADAAGLAQTLDPG